MTFDRKSVAERLTASAQKAAASTPTRAEGRRTCASRSPSRTLLLYGGYAAFFAVCFVLFAYFTFPYERVKSVLEQRGVGSGARPASTTKLSIGELGPHLLTGVALHDVVYEREGATRRASRAKINVDELTLRVSPLSCCSRACDVDFGADDWRRRDRRQLSSGDDGAPTHLEAELDAVDLAKLGLGALPRDPDQRGRPTGDIDVTLATEAGRHAGQRRPHGSTS